MTIKHITTAAAALGLILAAGSAHAGKFDNWTAIQSFTSEAAVCEITSPDTTEQTTIELGVVDIRKIQLRMFNNAGPHAAVPAGNVTVRIDGQDVLTGTGARDDFLPHDGLALSVKLSPQQFVDFLKAAKASKRMTITVGDGSASEYVMQTGMMHAYVEMTQCLDAMLTKMQGSR